MIRILALFLLLLMPAQAFAHGDQSTDTAALARAISDILGLMEEIEQNPANFDADESETMVSLHDIITTTEDQLGHYAERLAKDNSDGAERLKPASEQFFTQVHAFHKALHDKDPEKAQQALARANSAYKLLDLFLK